MIREGSGIGSLMVVHQPPALLADKDEVLLRTFADQAVIAIQNARLFNETKEALARQTASADILRVISQSPTDVLPVFDAIVSAAVRLLALRHGLRVPSAAADAISVDAGATPAGPIDVAMPDLPLDPAHNFPARTAASKTMLHLPDWSAIELPEHERRIHEAFGVDSALYLPMLRGDECIGLLWSRLQASDAFSDKEIALAESFRDQALIAIENVRLFNETKQSLERQTATADILRVISGSPTDVQPVFDAIVATARRLRPSTFVALLRRDGEHFAIAAHSGADDGGFRASETATPIDPAANFPSRVFVEQAMLHIPDWSAIELPAARTRRSRADGHPLVADAAARAATTSATACW